MDGDREARSAPPRTGAVALCEVRGHSGLGVIRAMVHVHPSVLIIDDNRDIRESFQSLLRFEGYAVETAENGREALSRLYGGLRPCIIILDLRMPLMSGLEFRREQLNHPEFAHIPVIVFSAGDELQQMERLHAEACLQKPVPPDQLLALLRKHCLK